MSKIKRVASKHGKQVASQLADNPAYWSNEEKIANDPSIQEFLKQVE